MVKGPLCNIIRSEVVLSDGGTAILYIVCVITILLAIGSSIFYYVERGHAVIKSSTPNFLQLVSVGCIMAAVGCLALLGVDSAESCTASTWLINFAFLFMFGALIIKTYRIYKIFNMKKLKIQNITQLHLLQWLAYLCLIEVIIRVINEGISPFELQAFATLTDADWSYATECNSRYETYFLVVSFGYKAILLLFGIFLAFQVKDVEKNFNESKLLGIAIYNCSFLTVVALPVLLVIQKNNPAAYMAFLVVCINYVAITTILILTGSKAYVIYYHLEESNAHSTKMKSEVDFDTEATRTSGRKSVDDEPFNLQKFDDMLNRQLSKLRLMTQNREEQQAFASNILEKALSMLRKDDQRHHTPNSPSGNQIISMTNDVPK